MNTRALRSGYKLLIRTLGTAGGVLAAPVGALAGALVSEAANRPHPLESLLTGLSIGAFAGVLGMIGNVRSSAAANKLEDKEAAQIADTAVLLHNHDLNLLVGAALDRALELAGMEGALAPHRSLIQRLRGRVLEYFQQLDVADVAEFLLEGDSSLLSQYFKDAAPETRTKAESEASEKRAIEANRALWGPILRDLGYRAQSSIAASGAMTSLALHPLPGLAEIEGLLSESLGKTFDSLVREILKEDATGRGPAGGKGWASLTLLFWGRLFSELRGMREQIEQNDQDLSETLGKVEERISLKLNEILRWQGRVALESDGTLAKWFGQFDHHLKSRLDEIAALSGHGLDSPEEFRRAYWQKRQSDPGLELLWEDAERAQLLTEKVVGRVDELDEFESFLDHQARWVIFWKGLPGAGKTRLMIEIARRATLAEYRVFFVSPDVHDLKLAFSLVRSTEPVLLIWDDYQGKKPDALRTFLNLQTLPNDPKGPIVKRVVTAWPTVNVLGEKARDPLYIERDISDISPQDLADYARQLVPTLTAYEAAEVVRISKLQPEALLRSVVSVLGGAEVRNIPPNPLERAYNDLVLRLKQGRGIQDWRELTNALLALALVGTVDLGEEDQRKALGEAQVTIEALGCLLDSGTISRSQQKYSLERDPLRAHLVRRALSHERANVLSGTPEGLVKFCEPMLGQWFDSIWGICALVAEGAAGERVRTCLLKAVAVEIEGLSSKPFDFRGLFALPLIVNVMKATVVETVPRWREALADQIARLRGDPGISTMAAQAYFNATVDESDPTRCEALADRIAELGEFYIVPELRAPEIGLLEAQAITNASIIQPDLQKRQAMANRIERIWSRYLTLEIAELAARLFAYVIPCDANPDQYLSLADRIAPLLEEHMTAEIALHEASAVFRATIGEVDPHRCDAAVKRIAELRKSYDTPSIADNEAGALVNLSAVADDSADARGVRRAY